MADGGTDVDFLGDVIPPLALPIAGGDNDDLYTYLPTHFDFYHGFCDGGPT